MPIARVPVVHKFGIISHTQRLELQERLLKQSYLQTLAQNGQISKNPFEVTEEFVQQYNSTESLTDRDKLDEVARKILHRIKRRAGLKENGQGSHVDLPICWTELSQMAQCKGKVQEECLDVLIASLGQAPLEEIHIPALFFLAETTLYWLRTDAVHQPYLRTGEIKLLRMGQLVFMRLFYHNMAGELQKHDEFKSRLFTYLNGFSECQDAYAPYPSALLSIRYICEVGKIVIGDNVIDISEVKEEHMAKGAPTDTETDHADGSVFREVPAQFVETQSTNSTAISNSVHDLSPTLWHALDVWRCVNLLSGDISQALSALAQCSIGLVSENWVDGVCAMIVLCDAAKSNMQTLSMAQNLARGIIPVPYTKIASRSLPSNKEKTTDRSSGESKSVRVPTAGPTSQPTLSDIRESTEPDQSTARSEDERSEQSKPTTQEPAEGSNLASKVKKPLNTDTNSSRSTEAKDATTKVSDINKPAGVPGLRGWHWEVVVTYVDMLADICLHGSTSTIQKVALLGNNKDTKGLHLNAAQPKNPMLSAGLLDLVYFQSVAGNNDENRIDWSWCVRYSAFQGLVKICRCSAGDSTKEGMRTVAWNTLLKAHSLEKDNRVLEALKVGQVGANIENLITEHTVVTLSTIGSKIATGLSKLYLPPLPPVVQSTTKKGKKQPEERATKKVSPPSKVKDQKQLRTKLNEEAVLAKGSYDPPPSFVTRTTFDLKRVVEDQWRKELQQSLTEEEDKKQKELKS